MSSFHRGRDALRAELEFRDVDVIFYIEGKSQAKNKDAIYDYRFYNAWISRFFDRPFSIKVCGSRTQVESIINELSLSEDDDGGNIVILDRDHNEFIPSASVINNKFVWYTQGYSWENDFWSTNLVSKLAEHCLLDDSKVKEYLSELKCVERRLRIIHLLNLLARANGHNLVKLSGWCGVNAVNGATRFIIRASEISRVRRAWEALNISNTKETRDAILRLSDDFYGHPGFLIQGHAFELFTLDLLTRFFHKHMGASKTNHNEVLKIFAMGLFMGAPEKYLSAKTQVYYKSLLATIPPR